MSQSPHHDDDPEMTDIAGLRTGASGGKLGLGWIVSVLVLLGIGLALWAYLR